MYTNKQKECIWLIEIYKLLISGKLSFQQTLECFKILCKYPDYFIIYEPLQNKTEYIYNIKITDKLINDLDV